ncbi:nuclear transport factor 2 family protein [Methylobacterium sp. WL64]|uniref:nuclear transport factor 2 family protein n=1 Tax=Methylobacterium sp. WL64 TaxID=2603894 RepID=UPI001AED2EE1|nr:nuclear transport factor 2 family protein [Methylobacterium sp. WL64]
MPHLDAVADLLIAALGDRLAPGVSDYMDLFREDGVLETPYVSEGSPARWEGRPAIAAFLQTLRGVVRLADFHLIDVYPAADGATVVLEYEGTVHLEQQGQKFRQRYISIVRTDHARITLWREYTNPLAAKTAA